jgi:hypothetical protein
MLKIVKTCTKFKDHISLSMEIIINIKISTVSFLRKFEHRLKGFLGWGGGK